MGRPKRNISPRFPITEETKPITKHFSSIGEITQVDGDTLDIDAALDDAIILREKRAADPGHHDDDDEEEEDEEEDEEEEEEEEDDDINFGGKNRRGNKNRRNRKNDDNDNSGRDPALDKLIRDIRQRIKDYKKFWSNLPHQICSNDEISTSTDVDGMCWNGHTIDRLVNIYDFKILATNRELCLNMLTNFPFTIFFLFLDICIRLALIMVRILNSLAIQLLPNK